MLNNKKKDDATSESGNGTKPIVVRSLPNDWQPRPIDIKSGWKHNANTLSKIVNAINDDFYIEDESAEMEKIDVVLGWIAERYDVVARQ